MNLQENIIEILKKYKELYKEEDIDFLIKFAEENDNSFSRLNKESHFTASGIVILENKVLLIFHNKLERFLQPGGHIESDDTSLLDAAKREVEEETGLKVIPHRNFADLPIHIDIQKIPENKKKNEPEHYHYDCMFIFETEKDGKVNLQEEEVSGFQWVDIDYDFEDVGIKKAIEKFKKNFL